MEARRKFGELLEGVFYRNDHVMIERNGKPMAAVIPAWRLEELDRVAQDAREALEKLRAAVKDPLPEDEAMALALDVQRDDRGKQHRATSKAKRTA
jgi:prevent-host-death family protein